MQARRALLPDGRWHFQHGPIDLVIGADGDAGAMVAAHAAAWQRFETVLAELVGELPALRSPVRETSAPCGPIARRMWQACWPHRAVFITPMAAVAGAVAQELIGHYERAGIARAWVNNGGDIALHLARGASVRVGLFADLARLDDPARIDLDGHFDVRAEMPVRGVATSGWRGRSFSLGIADSVTVLARDAAAADAAATIIANAVDVTDPRICRAPANTLKDDSDLGEIAVTVDVPPLEAALIQRALQAGQNRAQALQREGLIHAAMIHCQGRWCRVDAAGGVGASALEHHPALGSVFA
ncbi:MAG TPA: UPF0280 family protein [Burkholderiaceae bacterium]|jgi:hypothetical protein